MPGSFARATLRRNVADETERSDRRPIIADILAAIFDELGKRADSAHTRALRARARGYESTMNGWTTVPPSAAQIGAMFELVTELHAKAMEREPISAPPPSSTRAPRSKR